MPFASIPQPKNSSDRSSSWRNFSRKLKIIKKRWWSAGVLKEAKKYSIFFFVYVRHNCLFSLSHSLTHPLAVIASEFNYFFGREAEKLSISRSFWDVRHAKLFFLLLYPPMSESHEISHIHHLWYWSMWQILLNDHWGDFLRKGN